MVSKKARIDDLKSQIQSIELGYSKSSEDDLARHARKRRTSSASGPDERFDSESDAFNRIVSFLNTTERSEKQIREKLKSSGYSDRAIDNAVDRALSCSLIDDMRFADILIRSRISQGKGIQGIERELQENNIDPYAVLGWPEEYCSSLDSEEERAFQFMLKHPTHAKNLRDSAYRKLVSKGFSSSASATAARRYAEHFRREQ